MLFSCVAPLGFEVKGESLESWEEENETGRDVIVNPIWQLSSTITNDEGMTRTCSYPQVERAEKRAFKLKGNLRDRP